MLRHTPDEQTPITLWFCHLVEPISEEQQSLFHAWLSETEKQKVARFKQSTARDKGLRVRAALRYVLSQYAVVRPVEWQFEYGEKGKPRLCHQQRLQTGIEFNLSHSGDWLVIAVCQVGEAPQQLGVDIERFREKTDIYPILKHYFSQTEIEELLDLKEEERRDRFFDLWTLKESYIKAKGLGLALSLKSFEFDFSQKKIETLELAGVSTDTMLPIESDINIQLLTESLKSQLVASKLSGWQVTLGRLDNHYRFAVCMDIDRELTCLHAKKLEFSEPV